MRRLLPLVSLLFFLSCSSPDYSHNQVILYSRDDCDFCEEKHEWLEKHKIPYEEYFINRNRPRYLEIKEKLIRVGKWDGEVSTPALDVNGVVMEGNPGVEEIRRELRQ